MTAVWSLPLAVAAGSVLGWLYFEGLWLTVGRMVVARRPGLLWVASSVLRASLLLAAFAVMSVAGWQEPAAGLVGLLTARAVALRRHRPRPVAGGGERGC